MSHSSWTPCATTCVFCPVPFQKLVAAACPEPKLQKLVKNMVYVGVAAQMLGLDMDEVKRAIGKQLDGKQKAIELNQTAVQAGFDWAVGRGSAPGPAARGARPPDRRPDHHRRQLRLRPGRHVRRGHGGGLVSHHAQLLGGGDPDRLRQGLPQGPRHRQAERRHHPDGGRDRLGRRGGGRGLGRRPGHDRHLRARASPS